MKRLLPATTGEEILPAPAANCQTPRPLTGAPGSGCTPVRWASPRHMVQSPWRDTDDSNTNLLDDITNLIEESDQSSDDI
jgi:hypothetical protein